MRSPHLLAFLREPQRKIQNGGRLFLRHASLGSSLFAHADPLRSRCGTAFDGWESLVGIRRRSREEFANNRWGSSLHCLHRTVHRKRTYYLCRSKMAGGRFKVFRRALLGGSLFAHANPVRWRFGMASEGWESLFLICLRSREEFANNRFALLFIGIDYINSLLYISGVAILQLALYLHYWNIYCNLHCIDKPAELTTITYSYNQCVLVSIFLYCNS